MSDDQSKTTKTDRQRVNVHEPYELADWKRKFGVTADQLRDAVSRVGPMAKDVAKALGK